MVNNSESMRLKDILDGLQGRLEGELRGNRAAVVHPGARGEAAEEDWLKVLKAHLPHRYQADKAFVIDSRGACSEQIDVVVYDRQYSPFLYNHSNQRFIPAESVYAVIEVKQDLSREHIKYAGEKAASVQNLYRTSERVTHVEGIAKPRQLPRILAGILTYQSSWTPAFGDPLKDILSELQVNEQIDIGCTLTHGVFEVSYPSEGINLTLAEGPRSVVQFLMRFLKQLQSMGTAPAINYNAYLDCIQNDDQSS